MVRGVEQRLPFLLSSREKKEGAKALPKLQISIARKKKRKIVSLSVFRRKRGEKLEILIPLEEGKGGEKIHCMRHSGHQKRVGMSLFVVIRGKPVCSHPAVGPKGKKKRKGNSHQKLRSFKYRGREKRVSDKGKS